MYAHVIIAALAVAAPPAPSSNGGTTPLRAPGIHDTPKPQLPDQSGAGIIAAGAVFGTVGLGLNIARVTLARGLCRQVGFDPEHGDVFGTDACARQSEALLTLAPTALVLNLGALALIGGGSRLRGRWSAYHAAYMNGPRRPAGAQLAIGAVLVVASLGGYAFARVGSYLDGLGIDTCAADPSLSLATRNPADSSFAMCVRQRFSGYLIGITAAQVVGQVGGGLLVHGTSHRRHLQQFRGLAATTRLQPVFSPSSVGVSITGRF